MTHVTTRMGAEGVRSALKTLYFPAMVPLYHDEPLDPQERQDLAAFFQHADASAPPGDTVGVAGRAGLVFVLFVLIVSRAGRSRLRGVRRALLARARAASVEAAPKLQGEPR